MPHEVAEKFQSTSSVGHIVVSLGDSRFEKLLLELLLGLLLELLLELLIKLLLKLLLELLLELLL